jgi:DNA-directed RNA polymerase specialized sigma24 family protein
VLIALWRGTKSGLFDKISNRNELWWTLLKITKRKVATAHRRERTKKRGKWAVQSKEKLESDLHAAGFYSFDEVCNHELSPELFCTMRDQTNWLIGLLKSDEMRRIALWRIEGLTVNEIAKCMSLTPRSIERKLKIIRTRWDMELSRGHPK